MALNIKIPGFRDFLNYVYDIRMFIFASIIIFMFFAVIGYAVSVTSPGFTEELVSGFEEQVSPMKELTPLGLMWGIFVNNAVKCFLVLVFGIFFGIAPILFMIANGFGIGIVVGATALEKGLLFVTVGILPHGIIELTMVFIATAMGLKLGYALVGLIMKRDVDILEEVKKAFLIFIFWVAPLLFVAAFVETFITGTLLYLIFGGV
ncbi:hypothetical protein CUJ83_06430 [Methanocella sp. CWC-04]|uniref:Stage II sporulation protein M n=1 Tax=Methanooceanicella nereidis TaxID=2052831 RepID=A0AAP2RDK2_9EURY|nr:stage II sporulation protein M [Methanocella sp. CWC-04]MCD1294635.1 hypothetical protein [Methanocella sp. CWC-04]